MKLIVSCLPPLISRTLPGRRSGHRGGPHRRGCEQRRHHPHRAAPACRTGHPPAQPPGHAAAARRRARTPGAERQIVERLQLQLASETSPAGRRRRPRPGPIGRIADNNRLSPADFRKALEKDGISWERFRDEVRNEMLLGRVREREVDSRIVVSDAEVANYLPTRPRRRPSARSSTSPTSCSAPRGRQPRAARPPGPRPRRSRPGCPRRGFDKLAASYSDAPDASRRQPRLAQRRAPARPVCRGRGQASSPARPRRSCAAPPGFHLIKVLGRKGGSQAAMPRPRCSRPTPATSSSRPARSSPTPTPAAASPTCASASSRAAPASPTWPASIRPTSPPPRAATWAGSTRATPCPSSSRRWTPSSRARSASPSIQSPFGWHLIVVEERRVQDVSDDRKRAAARNALRERKSDEAFQDWLRQLLCDRAYATALKIADRSGSG